MSWLVQAAACGAVVLAFLGARRLATRLGNPPWASPVLVAALGIGLALWTAGVAVPSFEAAVSPLRAALVPAIVALGVFIHRGRGLIAAQPWPLFVAVTGGALAGVLSAVGMAQALGLSPVLIEGLATKTLSTPFAVAVATRVGGPVSLAAALAVTTGSIGAIIVPPLLRACRVRGASATGIAIGVSAHLVGTDWLTRHYPRAAGWSAVAMVLTGLLAALLLPLAWHWLA